MVGRTLSHYKVLEELSRSGMGVVYRAPYLKDRCRPGFAWQNPKKA
jgi:hypothetical protein